MLKKLVIALAACTAMGAAAHAQSGYPTQPVTVVVPFSAGGASDVLTRVVVEAMSRDLGQRVLVQNIGGAGGTVGSNHVVQADPDGYTLLMHHFGLSTAPTFYRNLPFDPLADLDSIGLVAQAPMAIVARQDFPPDTLQELISYVQENEAEITYGHAGIGGASYFCGLLFTRTIGVEVTMIPYQGTGPALADLMGGQFDFICDLTTGTADRIRSGEFKAYGLTAPERLDSLPDLPTTAEAGLDDFEISVWYGLYAPAGTPVEIRERLAEALRAALNDENVVRQLAGIGTAVYPDGMVTAEALDNLLSSQIDLWRPLIVEAGIYAD